jgi:hypothetical protein
MRDGLILVDAGICQGSPFGGRNQEKEYLSIEGPYIPKVERSEKKNKLSRNRVQTKHDEREHLKSLTL